MGKKILGVFVFLFFVLFIFNSINISAQDIGIDPDDPFGIGVTQDDLQNSEQLKETSSDYLKNEWTKLLGEGKFLGGLINAYRKISPVTDPIFKYSIGMEPELSGLFFITFIIWIVFFIYIYRIFSIASPFSKWVTISFSIGISIIIGIFGFPKMIAGIIMGIINGLATWWIRLIVEVVLITIFIILMAISKQFRDSIKNLKERHAKLKEELNRKRLEGAVNVAETFTKESTK